MFSGGTSGWLAAEAEEMADFCGFPQLARRVQ
jgi:hypothetical protein